MIMKWNMSSIKCTNFKWFDTNYRIPSDCGSWGREMILNIFRNLYIQNGNLNKTIHYKLKFYLYNSNSISLLLLRYPHTFRRRITCIWRTWRGTHRAQSFFFHFQFIGILLFLLFTMFMLVFVLVLMFMLLLIFFLLFHL